MAINVVSGTRSQIKETLLDYCLMNYRKKDIWLIDTMQIFDPYYLSRKDPANARGMLHRIRVSRPFTFYQLRDKLFTLTKIRLDKDSVVIISGFDCFNDEVPDANEKNALIDRMLDLLAGFAEYKGCRVILGMNYSKQEMPVLR